MKSGEATSTDRAARCSGRELREIRMAGRPKKQVQAETPLGATGGASYFRIHEAAAYLRCSTRFIGDSIRNEKLPKLKMGKKFVLMKMDLDAFAQSLRDAS